MEEEEDEEEKEVTKGPKFPITMYISEGNKYLRLMKYNTAIEFFDIALEREPTNEKSLLGRSKCNMRLAKYAEAKEDAEAALKAYPKSTEAKLQIGEAEYFAGDFEKAFITFHRAHTAKQNCEGLKVGHQMCRKAIDNALQPDKPITFDSQDIAGLSNLKLESDDEVKVEQKSIKDFLSRDVDFVNKLLEDDSVESAHPDCEYLVAYLRDRQQFWKTQTPETSNTSSETKRKTAEDSRKEDTKKLPDSNVETLDNLSSSSEDE